MAGGFFDKFKEVIGIEEDEFDEAETEELEVVRQPQVPERVPNSSYSGRSSNDFVQPKTEQRSKVVNMQDVSTNSAAKRQRLKLLITEPRSFNDCPELVDSLRARKPVIINVEHLERETARKIFDFLSGATYAIDGKVQKVSDNIFVFAPENVDVSAAVSSESADIPASRKSIWSR